MERFDPLSVLLPSPVEEERSPEHRPPPARRRRARPGRGALATLVIAVALLTVSGATRVVEQGTPGTVRGGSGSPGLALTYLSAERLALGAANGSFGAPWSLLTAYAIDSAAAVDWGAGYPCVFSGLPQNLAYLTDARPEAPAYDGKFGTGASPWWMFLFSNGSVAPDGQTIVLDVPVVNGTAITLGISHNGCYVGAQPAAPTLGLVDTSAAMLTAMSANRSFFATPPPLNVEVRLGTFLGADAWSWSFAFTTCPVTGVPGADYVVEPGVLFNILVNATSGVLPIGVLFAPEIIDCYVPP